VLIAQYQLDPFQEWPQLLDPLLPKLVNALVHGFLCCLTTGQYEHRSESHIPRSHSSPLPSAICCILNTLCKVRGVKVIIRFLNNEPKFLEPMLEALLMFQSNMLWQERYIILLWLSHLVLTPFDLQSISSANERLVTQVRLSEHLKDLNLPIITNALLFVGLENLDVASKERESASLLLVRIALRPDMQRQGLLNALVQLMFRMLHDYTQKPTASMYECLGCLSVLSGVIKSGSPNDVRPFLISIFDFALKAATTESVGFGMMRASAPARKMLVAILRTSTLHAISLSSRHDSEALSEDTVYSMLEGIIQYLLDALGDKDTPVRLSASKALSMLAQKLDPAMKGEVVQAVLDDLESDVLYQKPDSGDPIPGTLLTNTDMQTMSRNMTAVNALKWQGLLLTLSHMLFRRTAPPDHLSLILKSLLSGLDFEQRSAGGTSIGGSVRDAACFGLWSLSRKYATAELQSIEPSSVLPALKATFATTGETSILQIVATQLVVSACLDPSGNIRRGSSAALQELIGRHPDTIVQSIALVQVVDYHAVARRSRAMLDVAQSAGELSQVYTWALLNALLGWRGVRAVDDASRRSAAAAISKLSSLLSSSDQFTVLGVMQEQLIRLSVENSKTVAEARHGLLLAISLMLDTMHMADHQNLSLKATSPAASILQTLSVGLMMNGQILGNLNGRSIPDLILEGAASLISALMRSEVGGLLKTSTQIVEVLDLCLVRADQDASLAACAEAAFELLRRLPRPQKADLLDKWLDRRRGKQSSFNRKGRILALGTVYATLANDAAANHTKKEDCYRSKVFAQLTSFIRDDWPIETQVTSLRSLRCTIPHLENENVEEPLCAALDNYRSDQRGDVGSLARLEAVRVVSVLLPEWSKRREAKANHHDIQPLIQRLFRLAGEKLDKLRFEAWKCINILLAQIDIQSTQP
jgi:tubulin-specific chaperone D